MKRWAGVVVVLAIAVAAAVAAWRLVPVNEPATGVAGSGPVPIGGPFALTAHDGRRVTEQDFRGRLMLVFFGYTYCPDICPIGLQTMAAALDQLAPEQRGEIAPLFITFDPARDTVPVMRDYVGQFHPRILGLTGSEQEIADVLRAWRVYARKAEPGPGESGYLVDHSTFTYLMDRQGNYLTHFGHDTSPETMAARLREAVRQG